MSTAMVTTPAQSTGSVYGVVVGPNGEIDPAIRTPRLPGKLARFLYTVSDPGMARKLRGKVYRLPLDDGEEVAVVGIQRDDLDDATGECVRRIVASEGAEPELYLEPGRPWGGVPGPFRFPSELVAQAADAAVHEPLLLRSLPVEVQQILLALPAGTHATPERLEQVADLARTGRLGLLWSAGPDPETPPSLDDPGLIGSDPDVRGLREVAVEAELRRLAAVDGAFATVLDTNLPRELFLPVVWFRGLATIPRRMVAVVGQVSTPAGERRARRLARELAENGVSVLCVGGRSLEDALASGSSEGLVSASAVGLAHRDARRVMTPEWPSTPKPDQGVSERMAMLVSSVARAVVVIEGRRPRVLDSANCPPVFLAASLVESEEWALGEVDAGRADVLRAVDDLLGVDGLTFPE
jgi:hypothetical protein